MQVGRKKCVTEKVMLIPKNKNSDGICYNACCENGSSTLGNQVCPRAPTNCSKYDMYYTCILAIFSLKKAKKGFQYHPFYEMSLQKGLL